MMEQRQKPPFWRRESIRWGLTLGAAVLMMAAAALLTPGLLSDSQDPADGQQLPVVAGTETVTPESGGAEESGMAEGNTPAATDTDIGGENEQPPSNGDSATGDNEASGENEAGAMGDAGDVMAVNAGTLDWVLPLSGDISRGYGYDYNPSTEDYRFHRGCDIAALTESAVKAAAAGSVVEAETSEYWGGVVAIDHGGGWTSIYKCVEPAVNVGDTVSMGQIIGVVTEAPAEAAQETHLHFELEFEGESIDPLSLL